MLMKIQEAHEKRQRDPEVQKRRRKIRLANQFTEEELNKRFTI